MRFKLPKTQCGFTPAKLVLKNGLCYVALGQIYRNYSELGRKLLSLENGKRVAPPWIKGAFVLEWQRYFERKKINWNRKTSPLL